MPALTDEQSTSIPDEESAAVETAQSPEKAQSLTGKDDNEPRRASISRSKRAMWTLLFTCVFAVGIAIGVVLIQNPQPSPVPSRSSGETYSIFSDEVDGAGGVPDGPCRVWCIEHANPWSKKCAWKNCVGCDACQASPTLPPPSTDSDETPSSETEKPNIIVILADDVGTGDIPFYWKGENTSLVEMPNLEKLANNGVLFEDAHSTPLCAPSRYMLLSGNYPHRGHGPYGTWSMKWDMNQFLDDQRSIAQVLGDSGYHTGVFGKW